MSDLGTPSGRPPDTQRGAGVDPATGADDSRAAAAGEEMRRVRAELAATPVKDLVANHAIGLWQLALLHLGLDQSGSPPNLPEAKFAIDAMASLVDGVVDRLDDHADPLKDALTTLRLAFVRVSEDPTDSPGPGAPGGAGGSEAP